EMMTKLITETPDHPIPFLINHLQTKQGSPSKLQRTLSGSAALWADTGTTENKGTRRDFRSYEKPWQIHPKKPKKSKSDLAVSNISPPSPESKSLPRSIEHPSWDWRTRPESHDFDELNHILQESKKLGKALENLSRSIAVSDELDQDPLAFNCSLLRPRVIGEWVGREEHDADPLAAEMLQPPVPRTKTEQWESEDSSGPAGRIKWLKKKKGRAQGRDHHKKLIKKMLQKTSFYSTHPKNPSVTVEFVNYDQDCWLLTEDLDDLRMEGVTSLAPSGSKFSQGRSSYCPEPQARVTLNICSRCARLQGDSLLEARDEDLHTAQSPEQAVPEIVCPLPGAETLMEEDEEFESASQVTGPRQPVWDSELMSARGGTSPSQKQLRESFFSKELLCMEKHLAEVEKDIAKMAESTLLRSPNSPHSSLLLTPVLQGGLPSLPGPNSRPQSPGGFAGKSSPLSLQTNKPVSLATSRPQTPSNHNSRPQTPNSQSSRPRTPSGNRPVTPNSLMPRPVTPSNQGNKNENFGSQRSRPVTPTSQSGRPLLTPTGLTAGAITPENMGKAQSQRTNLPEDEFYQQLQAVRQPWLIPSDTDSDCVDQPDQDKCEFRPRSTIYSLNVF
uniref:Chromosome 8 open reading frame 34 n=1 Tax=Lepisosteus oculatus TaxID=7918 RepID=W5M9M2_LEPOC